MSYTPTQWQTGDTITAEKLNNMESGIDEAVGNAPLVLRMTVDGHGATSIDVPYADVLSAINDRRPVILYSSGAGDQAYVYACTTTNDGIARIAFVSALPDDRRRRLTWVEYYPDGSIGLYDVSDDSSLRITLAPTAQDFSGTLDVNTQSVFEALANNRQINFTIESLAVVFPATIFSLFDANNDGIEESAVCGAIVPYNIGGQDVLIKIMTNPDGLTYSTTIYPLTPMS